MPSRYRVARAMGKQELEQVMREDEELLGEFGLRLMYADSGIRAAVEEELRGDRIHPWNIVEVNEKTWEWMRPLLVELRKSRGSQRVPLLRVAK